MHRSFFLLPLLVACGPSEDKFQDRFAESACETLMECSEDGGDSGFSLVFFENQEQCESFYSLAWGFMGECDYDIPYMKSKTMLEVGRGGRASTL